MLGMKKAGHRRIIVPPHLAYGPKGVPGRVPANSTLIFEVELQRVPSPRATSSPSQEPSLFSYQLAELNKCRLWDFR